MRARLECDTIVVVVIRRRSEVKSVRLDPELETNLERAARIGGVSQSAFIREAVRRRCQEVLGGSLAEALAELGVIGAVSLGGGYAEHAGKRFTELLEARREKQP